MITTTYIKMKKLIFIMFVLFGFAVLTIQGAESQCETNFEYQYRVLESIVDLKAQNTQNDEAITSQSTKLEDALHTIEELSATVIELQNQGFSTGSTYIRWGRMTCPEGDSVKVYDGWVGGSHYTQKGSGTNLQCMPRDPIFGTGDNAEQSIAFIYGTEYEFGGKFQNHVVPCAVCWIPRSSNIMLPARSECYPGWKLEYHGYLASEHHLHSPSEYVCVAWDMQKAEGSTAHSIDGSLLYYVEVRCGALPCETYPGGKDLTCAVCSYSPQTTQTSVRPYA